MAVIDEFELKRQIKEKDMANLYFIYGEETYLKKLYCDRIIKKIVGRDSDGYYLQKFDGNQFDIDIFGDTVEAFPMMGGVKCLCVCDLNVSSAATDIQKKLQEILSDVPEYCYILFWLDGVKADMKNAKWKSFGNVVSKHGCVIEFKTADKNTVSRMLREGAQKHGCTMSTDIASYILRLAGSDMQTLSGELEKICAYCGEGEIKREQVDMVLCKSIDAKGYEMAKAIIKNDFSQAFAILDQLVQLKVESPVILAAVTGSYVDIYRAKCAVLSGTGTECLTKAFASSYRGREFKLKYAVNDGKKLSLSRLRESIELLYQTDLRLKSSRTDNRIIIEELISKLLVIAAREARAFDKN